MTSGITEETSQHLKRLGCGSNAQRQMKSNVFEDILALGCPMFIDYTLLQTELKMVLNNTHIKHPS